MLYETTQEDLIKYAKQYLEEHHVDLSKYMVHVFLNCRDDPYVEFKSRESGKRILLEDCFCLCGKIQQCTVSFACATGLWK